MTVLREQLEELVEAWIDGARECHRVSSHAKVRFPVESANSRGYAEGLERAAAGVRTLLDADHEGVRPDLRLVKS